MLIGWLSILSYAFLCHSILSLLFLSHYYFISSLKGKIKITCCSTSPQFRGTESKISAFGSNFPSATETAHCSSSNWPEPFSFSDGGDDELFGGDDEGEILKSLKAFVEIERLNLGMLWKICWDTRKINRKFFISSHCSNHVHSLIHRFGEFHLSGYDCVIKSPTPLSSIKGWNFPFE